MPPPCPPSERLIQAIEAFYGPPSHDNPRDRWEFPLMQIALIPCVYFASEFNFAVKDGSDWVFMNTTKQRIWLENRRKMIFERDVVRRVDLQVRCEGSSLLAAAHPLEEDIKG